jgi:hypothetical protein
MIGWSECCQLKAPEGGVLQLRSSVRYSAQRTSRRHRFHDISAAASHESFLAAILRAERAPSTRVGVPDNALRRAEDV